MSPFLIDQMREENLEEAVIAAIKYKLNKLDSDEKQEKGKNIRED
jgi:hypothetical protein